jgi:hypothetical protein
MFSENYLIGFFLLMKKEFLSGFQSDFLTVIVR